MLKDLGKLGKLGSKAKVKDGYANNYLIPEGLALPASEKNFKQLEEIKRKKAKLIAKEKEKVLALKGRIEAVSLTVAVEVKEDDKLYGAVGAGQILKLLKAEDIELEKEQLALDTPLDKLGAFNLKIRLSAEVEALLRVWVVRK